MLDILLSSHFCSSFVVVVVIGNRPSNVLLLPRLSSYEVGQLLSLYEHRTVVEGFIWGINSFDQWGVELGKKLADKVRTQLVECRKNTNAQITKNFNFSTINLLKRKYSHIRKGEFCYFAISTHILICHVCMCVCVCVYVYVCVF